MLLDLKWQSVLEQARDLLSVMTMPIADGEEVAVA